jgi:AcrR family transcriptional regulator
MAVYNHFADRDALLRAAVEHCWAEFQAAIAGALADPDPVTRLRDVGAAYVRFALERPAQYGVMFSITPDLPSHPVAIGMTAFDDLVALVGEVLAAADDDRDPTFVAIQVHTWVHGIVTLTACAPDDIPWPPIDALLDDAVVRLGLAGA